ncbi:MAG: PIN domain-containing protein [Pseudomonadota bacterium]
MSDKVFIDSNIIVYAYDSHEPAKQTKAQALLTSAIKEESAMLSVQVLGEFFVVVTRRIKNPLSVDEAEKIVNILATLPVSEIDLSLVRRAIETQKEYGISYWDSLIISTAKRAGCTKVLSEDLNEGQIYNNVLVENPFNLIEGDSVPEQK